MYIEKKNVKYIEISVLGGIQHSYYHLTYVPMRGTVKLNKISGTDSVRKMCLKSLHKQDCC